MANDKYFVLKPEGDVTNVDTVNCAGLSAVNGVAPLAGNI